MGAGTWCGALRLPCASGEFVGLIGPNGCGKSTLLRLLSGFCVRDRAEFWLDKRALTSFTAREIARRMAFVPQEEKAAFEFSVQDVVLMGRFPHRAGLRGPTSEDYADCGARSDGAGHWASESAFHHGVVGRASIGAFCWRGHWRSKRPCCCWTSRPRIWTSRIRRNCWNRRANLPGTRVNPIGALAALHDLNQAAEFCDRLVLMHEGQVLAQGTPDEVLQPDGLRIAYQG